MTNNNPEIRIEEKAVMLRGGDSLVFIFPKGKGIFMKLNQLIASIPTAKVIGKTEAVDIKNISIDSRKVRNGDLFVCIRGALLDGHKFATLAIENGAVALLVEEQLPLSVPQVIVRDTVRGLAIVSDRFFGHPTHSLNVIAVTGTNGKTTTTNLIESICKDHGKKTGLIGTIEARIGDQVIPVKNTTPDALVLQSLFNQMKQEHTDYAIIEASSRALQVGRLWGSRVKTAVFTNLTQDHLDEHGTMDHYKHAKGLLFSQLGNAYEGDHESTPVAILNVDDFASSYFASVTAAPIITYGIEEDADVRAIDVTVGQNGTSFKLQTFCGNTDVSLRMIGKFNVYNALAAIATCLHGGLPLQSIVKSLEAIPGVSGRFETVDVGQAFTVIVDYAHTPDSLENVLSSVREFVKGKVYCVFGCGGDRDRTKRPLMGGIAAKLSDVAIVTSDNPRSEDPERIIEDVIQGMNQFQNPFVNIVDRREAVHYALSLAKAGDVVVIAGKGHETYQTIKGVDHHFDDREVARNYLRSNAI